MIKNKLLAHYFSNIYYIGCKNCKINCHLCETKETYIAIDEYKRVYKYFPIYFKKNSTKAYIHMAVGDKCIYHSKDHLCNIYDDRLDMCKRYPFNYFEEDGEFIFEFYDMLCHGVTQGKVSQDSFAIVEGDTLTPEAIKTFVGDDYTKTMEKVCSIIDEFVSYLQTNDLLIPLNELSSYQSDTLKIDTTKIDTIDKKYQEYVQLHISSLQNLKYYTKS